MSINLPNNPAFQNVNLSNVTQAAQGMGGSNTPGGGAVQNYGGGNPSTSLNLSGQTSRMGQNFANYGKQFGQVPITGPSGQRSGGGNQGGSGAPNPNAIAPGSYTPQNLTQGQRQSLWEHFGHKGIAPMGYGGENPTQQPFSPTGSPLGNTIQSFLPSFTPPPSPVSSATMTPGGASGATGGLSSVMPGAGGSPGATQALTQAGQATKGLQIPGLPGNILNALGGAVGGIGKDVAGALGTFANQFTGGGQTPSAQTQDNRFKQQGYNPQADTGGATDPFRQLSTQVQEKLGLNPAQVIHPVQHAA